MADAADKPPFDIYGMLLVLTFVVYLGGFLIVNDDLASNYAFKLFGDKDTAKRATHLTEPHDPSKDTPYIVIRKEDLDDYKAIKGGQFPIKDWEWPGSYDPVKNPVLPDKDNMAIPADQLKELMSTFDKAPEEAPKEVVVPVVPPGTDPSTTATVPSTTPVTTASTTPVTVPVVTPVTTPETK